MFIISYLYLSGQVLFSGIKGKRRFFGNKVLRYDNFKLKNKQIKYDQIHIRYDIGIFGDKDKILILEDKSNNDIILRQYKIGEWFWDFSTLSREVNKIRNE